MKKITTGKFETNSYIVDSGSECVLVDPGFGIENYLEEINKYKVVAILLTHCHCDHIDGIGYFDCPIYIHEDDKEGLKNHCNLYSMLGDTPTFNYSKLNIKTFHGEDIIKINDFVFEVIHTPGHTKGSSCFLYKEQLITGDTLFKNSIGRTDFPTGDHKTILNSLKTLVNGLDPRVKVLPGHGENSTIKDEKKNNIFLK